MLASVQAHAWRDKVFAHKKVQVLGKATDGKITFSPDDDLLVLADVQCLATMQAADKKHGDPFVLSGLSVQHKSSGILNRQAFAAHVTDTVDGISFEEKIERHPCIIGVTDNPQVKTAGLDPYYQDQLYLPSIGYDHGQKFYFHPIWGARQNVTVGVVDSGIQADHEDLKASLWRNQYNEYGYDFVNADGDPADDFGHGTHVSGIVAATRDNGVGIRGIMGSLAKIMSAKSQDDLGNGNMADVINAINWSVDNGAEVLNLSLASVSQNAALLSALQYALSKQVVISVAAGNLGQEITMTNFISPVGYAKDYAGIIGVGSNDALDFSRSSFSNYSSTYVELSAPGAAGAAGIFSTYLNSTYQESSGTSMSAPQVAGAAALAISFLKTRGVAPTAAQIEDLIQKSAVRQSANAAFFLNGQRLDVERLGRLLYNTYLVNSDGGFDVP